jgi:hypothetical protein
MNINRVNISAAAQLPKLSLHPGQVINTQVIKTEGSQILLQYGGYLFKAQTGLVLQPGDKLQLLVESIEQNIINLKIIGGEELKQPGNFAAIFTTGQKIDKDFEAMARQLTKFNLPVSLELLNELNKIVKKNKLPMEISQLLAWLKSAGYEVSSQQDIKALQSLHKFFKGESIDKQESKYFDFLNAAENQAAGGVNIYGWPIGNHQVYFIKEGPKNEALPAEHCRLVLKVDSLALKELWFLIEVFNQNMTASIYCSEEKFKTILEQELTNLTSALQENGYQISDIKIQVKPGKTTIFDFIPEKEISNFNIEI